MAGTYVWNAPVWPEPPTEYPVMLDLPHMTHKVLARYIKVLPGEWQGLGVSSALYERLQHQTDTLTILTLMEFLVVENALHKIIKVSHRLKPPNRRLFLEILVMFNALYI